MSNVNLKKPISVLFETEGTYPFSTGGVSVWCDILCRELKHVNFHIFSVTGQPNVKFKYTLPANISELKIIPLWGNDDPLENALSRNSVYEIYQCKKRTTNKIIAERFIPALNRLLEKVLFCQEEDVLAAYAFVELYRYFLEFDYKVTFRSQLVWEYFKSTIERYSYLSFDKKYDLPNIGDLTNCLRLLYHYLIPLAYAVPDTDVTHTSIAGFCGLSSIISKIEYGTPLLVTDHGVYIRERYLAISRSDFPQFSKKFLITISSYVSKLCYLLADQISPVCDYNKRWEIYLGAPISKIKTIYNGVDPEKFYPAPKPEPFKALPTVVAAANVNPLKDIITMIQACDEVKKEIPNVRFVVYGSTDCDPKYTSRCRSMIQNLQLENNFTLAGYCYDKSVLYNTGDISLITSVSEGFPYALIESMACARPAVATNVGGVSEALADTGVLVKPRDIQSISRAIIDLLIDDQRRYRLGRRARERVLNKYHISLSINAYNEAYFDLANRKDENSSSVKGQEIPSSQWDDKEKTTSDVIN